jgi:hypothetical protein
MVVDYNKEVKRIFLLRYNYLSHLFGVWRPGCHNVYRECTAEIGCSRPIMIIRDRGDAGLHCASTAFFAPQVGHTSPKFVIFLDSSQNFDFDEAGFDYADAARILRFSALSADSTTPSLAFAHVS